MLAATLVVRSVSNATSSCCELGYFSLLYVVCGWLLHRKWRDIAWVSLCLRCILGAMLGRGCLGIAACVACVHVMTRRWLVGQCGGHVCMHALEHMIM